MKRRILASVIVLLSLSSVAAFAGSSDLGLFLAFTKPKEAANSWGGGLTSRIRFIEIKSTLFENMTVDQSKFSCPPFCANGKPKLRYGSDEAGLFYKFFNDGMQYRPIQPYLGAGGGFYEYHELNNRFGRFNSQWGWYGEAGADLNVTSRWGFMVEVNYRDVKGTLEGVPIGGPVTTTKAHLQLGGPGVNAGLVWHFI
jgi:hypothetical protein